MIIKFNLHFVNNVVQISSWGVALYTWEVGWCAWGLASGVGAQDNDYERVWVMKKHFLAMPYFFSLKWIQIPLFLFTFRSQGGINEIPSQFSSSTDGASVSSGVSSVGNNGLPRMPGFNNSVKQSREQLVVRNSGSRYVRPRITLDNVSNLIVVWPWPWPWPSPCCVSPTVRCLRLHRCCGTTTESYKCSHGCPTSHCVMLGSQFSNDDDDDDLCCQLTM